MSETDAAKAALRSAARQARRSASGLSGAAEGVRDQFLGAIAPVASVVAGYWPFGDELDVRPLLRQLHERGDRLALPVCGPRGTPLTFRAWTPGSVLVPGRYGIAEPVAGQTALVPAVVLVPLLAFDRAGRRLGYGAGYYDRTLAGLREAGPVLSIGIAYSAQEVVRVPVGAHDERLDWIVTEREAIPVGKMETVA